MHFWFTFPYIQTKCTIHNATLSLQQTSFRLNKTKKLCFKKSAPCSRFTKFSPKYINYFLNTVTIFLFNCRIASFLQHIQFPNANTALSNFFFKEAKIAFETYMLFFTRKIVSRITCVKHQRFQSLSSEQLVVR